MIDKTPIVYKKLTLKMIMDSFKILAQHEYRFKNYKTYGLTDVFTFLLDNNEVRLKHDGFNRKIYKFSFDFEKQAFDVNLEKSSHNELENSISSLQDNVSKNRKKLIHKIVNKYEKQQCPFSCISLLKLISHGEFQINSNSFWFMSAKLNMILEPIKTENMKKCTSEIRRIREEISGIENTLQLRKQDLIRLQKELKVMKSK